MDVVHHLVALDRLNPPVRKRHESACSDQGVHRVAIEWTGEFVRVR